MKWISREELHRHPNWLFVFGDNLRRVGMGGQAKAMRGEPNAVGLPTKRSPHEYLTDADLQEVMRASREDRARLIGHLKGGGNVIWPADGIGTGLADLANKAPAIFTFYVNVRANLTRLGAKY